MAPIGNLELGIGDQGHDRASSIEYLAFTPTALNSRAQRCAVRSLYAKHGRVAHAGLPITHMTEPQRGSTMNQHSILVLRRKKSAVSVNKFKRRHTSPHFSQIFYCAPEYRHWCGLRLIRLPVLRTVAGRLRRVSTQFHPLICTKPTPALGLHSLATNFVRNAG